MAGRKRLGEMLLEVGVIDQAQLDAALGHQRKWGGRLGQALVDLRIISEARVVEALSRKFGYEVIEVATLAPGPVLEAALKLMPREDASRNNVLPYASDSSTISVAMSDPGNIPVVDEIRFRTGRRVKVALAGDREIAAAVRRFYYPGEKEPAAVSLDIDESDVEIPMEPDQPGATAAGALGGAASGSALDRFFAAPAASAAPRAAAPGAATGPRPSGRASAPAPTRAARSPAGALPAPEPTEKSGTFELPLDAELPPEGDGLDLWSQGPVQALAAPAAAPAGPRLAGRDPEILGLLDQLARGGSVPAAKLNPSQLAAALARLLLRKQVVSLEEILQEMGKR